MSTLNPRDVYRLWPYIPSLPGAIVAAVLFALATVFHGVLMFKNRLWFCLPFVIGGVFEVIGYIGRAVAKDRTNELLPYLIQSIFLLLAPVLFAASLYMTLSRVIRAVDGAAWSMIRPAWLTRIFVFGDVFSFLVQASGAGLLAQADSSDDDSFKKGQYIVVGGLVFQILMFAGFVASAVVFHWRFRRHAPVDPRVAEIPWRGLLGMLYVTSAFIMVRNVFRTVQFGQGHVGYLSEQEWVLYVFDGLLMLATMLCFAFRYPSRLVRNKVIRSSFEMEMA